MSPEIQRESTKRVRMLPTLDDVMSMTTENDLMWLSTKAAAERLGITQRTLYRFIDEGQVPAYRFGRVIRLKQTDVDAFIEKCRIEPGTLEHLYPDTAAAADGSAA